MLRRIAVAGVLLLGGCSAAQAPRRTVRMDVPRRLEVHSGFSFAGTVVGGLSGIAYDSGREVYYVISDDRSAKNPARFYTVRIPLADNRFDELQWVSCTVLRDAGGEPFAPLDAAARPPVIPPDPEGIAFDVRRQQLVWTSEGARDVENVSRTVVGSLGPAGRPRRRLPRALPVAARAGDVGTPVGPACERGAGRPHAHPRRHGPVRRHGGAGLRRRRTADRIARGAHTNHPLRHGTGEPTAQYAYPVDPVTAGRDGDNGLSDLVALDADTFLVVERGYGDRVSARIYRASTAGADDIIGSRSLGADPPVVAMTKELVVDLTAVPEIGHLDNVEGMTLGPKLSDGRQSVVLVTDDNFSPRQVTQFHVFAM